MYFKLFHSFYCVDLKIAAWKNLFYENDGRVRCNIYSVIIMNHTACCLECVIITLAWKNFFKFFHIRKHQKMEFNSSKYFCRRSDVARCHLCLSKKTGSKCVWVWGFFSENFEHCSEFTWVSHSLGDIWQSSTGQGTYPTFLVFGLMIRQRLLEMLEIIYIFTTWAPVSAICVHIMHCHQIANPASSRAVSALCCWSGMEDWRQNLYQSA